MAGFNRPMPAEPVLGTRSPRCRHLRAPQTPSLPPNPARERARRGNNTTIIVMNETHEWVLWESAASRASWHWAGLP